MRISRSSEPHCLNKCSAYDAFHRASCDAHFNRLKFKTLQKEFNMNKEVAAPKMKFVMLLKVVRLNNPAVQTVEFVERVDSWFAQWTVANNFEPRITHDVNNALRQWLEEFKRSYHTVIGSKYELRMEKQFGFVYTVSDVEIDKPFYLKSGNREIDCQDIISMSA